MRTADTARGNALQAANDLAVKGIGLGDLIVINHNGDASDPEKDDHVGMIVGWGPIVSSWSELQSKYPSAPSATHPSPLDLGHTQDLKPTKDSAHAIPYIVDHGPHGWCTLLKHKLCKVYAEEQGVSDYVFAGPKPFYAMSWNIASKQANRDVFVGNNVYQPEQDWTSGNWKFVHVPSKVTIPYDELATMKQTGFDEAYFLTTIPTVCPTITLLDSVK